MNPFATSYKDPFYKSYTFQNSLEYIDFKNSAYYTRTAHKVIIGLCGQCTEGGAVMVGLLKKKIRRIWYIASLYNRNCWKILVDIYRTFPNEKLKSKGTIG